MNKMKKDLNEEYITKCLYWQTQTYPLYVFVTKFFLASLIVFDPFSTPYHRIDA